MKEKFRRSYWLWGLYKGIFIAFESDLFESDMDNDEINSALYGYWIDIRDV